MKVWDISTEPPTLTLYCDECGAECDNDIDFDGKNYCNSCLALFNAMNENYFGGQDDEG